MKRKESPCVHAGEYVKGKFGPEHKFAEGDHRTKNKLFLKENYA
ncbi:hypothetical protein [Microcoleus sp. herbarium12]